MAQIWEKFIITDKNVRLGERNQKNRRLVGAAVLLGTVVACKWHFFSAVGLRLYAPARVAHAINCGTKFGQACGILTLMFAGFKSALFALREQEDEANTVLAATATGYLYGSTRGFQRMVYSGATGIALGMLLAIYTSHRDLLSQWKMLLVDFVYAKDINQRP